MERARLIRYTELPMGLLSTYDKAKNIIRIDRTQRERLTPSVQNLLDTCTHERTIVVESGQGNHFVPV